MNTRGSIIQSLFDIDFYKLTMLQFVWAYFPGVRVKYAFTNRTHGVKLANFIDEEELRRELDHVRELRITGSETEYLRNSPHTSSLFSEEFLWFLRKLRLPPVNVERRGNTYAIEVEGLWSEVMLWETIILSIVNELYYRGVMVEEGVDEARLICDGLARLEEKMNRLRPYRIWLSDFGTRRRFSRSWQRIVFLALHADLGNQLSTSNVELARRYRVQLVGTMAHELTMVLSAIAGDTDEDIRRSPTRVLDLWFKLYGTKLAIALPDTYGSDSFLRHNFSATHAREWCGFRHDSGDPVDFGQKVIAFYLSHDIDPTKKVIVFSDGLDVDKIIRLHEHFRGMIQTSFGWGTNLTNDLTNARRLRPLSLVVKAVAANGRGTVKLSDNLAKAMGDPKDVERFKRIFGYTNTDREECRY